MKKYALRNWSLEIITAVLILLFVYTALSKLFHYKRFQNILSSLPAIGFAGNYLAWILPVSEMLTALFLFVPKLRILGFLSSFVLMMLFTGYLGYMLYFTPDRPCNCGGVLQAMNWGQHLAFNIFFTIISLIGIYLQKHKNLLLQ